MGGEKDKGFTDAVDRKDVRFNFTFGEGNAVADAPGSATDEGSQDDLPEADSIDILWAKLFHETYERLAPDFDYSTRVESAVPWADVPENNRNLMIATVREVRHIIESIGEQHPETTTNSVTPQGAQATPKPNSKSTPNNSKDLESAPQPEKREGPRDWSVIKSRLDGKSYSILDGNDETIADGFSTPDDAKNAIAVAAFAAGQTAQPEGDERRAAEVRSQMNAYADQLEQQDAEVLSGPAVIGMLRDLAAALGSGEGGKDA